MVLVKAVVNKSSDSLPVVTHRAAVVKVKTLVEKLDIIDKKRWSIYWQTDMQRLRF